MKHINPIKSMILAASIGLSLAACGNGKPAEDHSTHEGHVMSEMTKVTDSVTINKISAQRILDAYLELKDALVKTDITASKEAASRIVTLAIEKDNLTLQIKGSAEQIAKSDDIAVQRNAFSALSNNVYTLVKSNLAAESTIYYQFCPMAQNNQGAYWLSSEKEIMNPYFGDMMLHCGSVKEEI